MRRPATRAATSSTAFVTKYGKKFVATTSELMPDCDVNRHLVELLCVCAPSAEKNLKLLKEIAEEHGLDWAPSPKQNYSRLMRIYCVQMYS
ncbi:hypothetical protein RND81_11G040600 [Saponaria officinalis]|uniref:Uncharacterized protein n=1 Tax=Saponaria officinalis TaxID=3572 RepID=A0AAW1HHN7_SAPOF